MFLNHLNMIQFLFRKINLSIKALIVAASLVCPNVQLRQNKAAASEALYVQKKSSFN